jgi:hypothetical protein
VLRRYLSAFSGSLAVHAGLILLLLWPLHGWSFRAGGSASIAAPAPPAMPVFVAPQEDARFPGLKPVDPNAASRIQPLDEDASTVSIGDFTFDASKLVERAAVLFPFVSPGVSLDHFAIHPGDERALIYQRPAAARTTREGGPDDRPLELSSRAFDALIDKTWSRRERWTAFQPILALAPKYSASAGAMPLVVQRYTDLNALQPYQDMAIRDPRMWAQLGIVADHVKFIGFIRQYVAEHPGTRTSTALLFLLDRLAEASEDGLEVLLDSNPETDLRWTRESNRDAYRLALQLRVYYRNQVLERGLRSNAAIAAHYARVRLDILEGILRTTPDGYRANDARFLIGAIHWRERQRDEALAAWRSTVPVAGDSYFTAIVQLKAALRADDPALRARLVDAVLKTEMNRWIDQSYDRLKRFGYRFDTY